MSSEIGPLKVGQISENHGSELGFILKSNDFQWKSEAKCENTKFHRKNGFEEDFKAPESYTSVLQHHTSTLWETKIFDFSLGFSLFWLPWPVITNDLVGLENFRMKKKVCTGFRRAEAKSSKILPEPVTGVD